MSPAKVIPPKREPFIVPEGVDIHQMPEHDLLPREDRCNLALRTIIGSENGFIIRKDGEDDIIVTKPEQSLNLPEGTRIEPIASHKERR
jgi:hypothetical protein